MESKERIRVPEEMATLVMFKADRTCCVCRNSRLPVQIHHIDEDPSNNAEENLAVLCTVCHDDTLVHGGFGRKLNPPLVRKYKEEWESNLASKRAGLTNDGKNEAIAKAPIRIQARMVRSFIAGGGTTEDLGRQVSVVIVNTGDRTRFIERLGVRIGLTENTPRYSELHFLGSLRDFQRKMESGEKRTFSVGLTDLTQGPFHDGVREGEVFNFFAQDTIGEMYYSNQISYEKE